MVSSKTSHPQKIIKIEYQPNEAPEICVLARHFFKSIRPPTTSSSRLIEPVSHKHPPKTTKKIYMYYQETKLLLCTDPVFANATRMLTQKLKN